MKKTSNELCEYISNHLSEGRKIAIPEAILEQENLSVDEMNDYFIVERGSFGLINFMGFRRVF
jgi:hypothetical protein